MEATGVKKMKINITDCGPYCTDCPTHNENFRSITVGGSDMIEEILYFVTGTVMPNN